jgi:putative transposase
VSHSFRNSVVQGRFSRSRFLNCGNILRLRKNATVPIPQKYKAPFHAGSYYHLRFRSIDGLKLFPYQESREFYLQQFSIYFQSVMDCFAFGLLDNHTHFIVRIKNTTDLLGSICSIPRQFRTKPMQIFSEDPINDHAVSTMTERQVNSFMASYAKAINKLNSRKGGLFQSPFRRSLITNDQYLRHAIIYTHANAQKHGVVKDFREYRHTSYHEILAGKSENVNADFVIDLFGGREMYIQLHERQANYFYGQQQ